MPFVDEVFEYIGDIVADVKATIWPASSGPSTDRPCLENPLPAPFPNGNVVINGVTLSQSVIDQLRQHGFVPGWCNHFELLAAEQEAQVDGTVFHDPDGNDFFDDLQLTEEKIEEYKDEIEPLPYRIHMHVHMDKEHQCDPENPFACWSFCEMEKKRRKKKLNDINDDDSNAESHGGL